MFFYDPSYMVIMLIGIAITTIPQMLVKGTFNRYSKVGTQRNLTGAQAAQSILQDAGIQDVSVEPTEGTLSDHYDPTQKVIRLSKEIYYGNSVAALGVAAHEAGHAIQDYRGYFPMKLRSGILPAVMLGQNLGPILIMAAIGLQVFLHATGLTTLVALAGIALYGSVVVFHIITLPVELNASGRALKILSSGGYLVGDEIGGAKKVLTAAAMTYIAVALFALIQLLYYIWLLFGRNDRD